MCVRGQEIVSKSSKYYCRKMPSGYGNIPSRPRDELYALAFRSFHNNRGSFYDCSQLTIDRATHLHGHHSGQYVSLRRAVDEIVAQNDLGRTPGPSESQAIHRLRYAKNRCEQHLWGPDLVIKAFLDLDNIFFCRRLRDIVRVEWKRNLRDQRMAGCCTSITTGPKSRCCVIWLNADVILRAQERRPFQEMFATILHEMW